MCIGLVFLIAGQEAWNLVGIRSLRVLIPKALGQVAWRAWLEVIRDTLSSGRGAWGHAVGGWTVWVGSSCPAIPAENLA